MAAPNMATITASLERSLRNCSLNAQHAGEDSDSAPNVSADAGLELNSQGSLPFHWEQCLDLKTGEIYFINWRTGMKAKEDPRSSAAEHDRDEYSGEDDSSSYDSEDSTSESYPSSCREEWSGNNPEIINYYYSEKDGKEENNSSSTSNSSSSSSSVLVVAGCKRCLMYYMVPKQLQICPKCCGHLLHFDRSGNAASSS